MVKIEKCEDINPVCPYCKMEITRILFREVQSDIVGSKRFIYFCPECKCSLGISHRKGFFFGF